MRAGLPARPARGLPHRGDERPPVGGPHRRARAPRRPGAARPDAPHGQRDLRRPRDRRHARDHRRTTRRAARDDRVRRAPLVRGRGCRGPRRGPARRARRHGDPRARAEGPWRHPRRRPQRRRDERRGDHRVAHRRGARDASARPHGCGAAARLPEPVPARPPARRARPRAHRRAVPVDRDGRGRRPSRPAHRRRLLGRPRLHHLHERARRARAVQRRGGARAATRTSSTPCAARSWPLRSGR